jgi:four helix bundle protein
MNNKEFGRNLEEQTKKFEIAIINLSASLPNILEAKVIRNQITKSGTSIGVNYNEPGQKQSRFCK